MKLQEPIQINLVYNWINKIGFDIYWHGVHSLVLKN